MKLYYVYILECADKFLYTGITNNISRRFLEHQQGLHKNCFTYKRRPVELIFYMEFKDVNQAIFFEKKIKKWSRAKKLALSNSDFDSLHILSRCNNASHFKNNTSLTLGLDSALPDKLEFNRIFESKKQPIELPILKEKNIDLFIKREDEIHPLVSGNKFRKLKYNLQEANQQEKTTLLTFGGAFSNHILATAVAGKLQDFRTIGIIRGEELGKDLAKTLASNTTLRNASEHGMMFEFISREEYRNKTSNELLQNLQTKYGDFYMIPEGGSNEMAIKGCEEILTTEDHQFDYICSSVGTGGTIAGIINSVHVNQKVLGFPALKGDFLESEIEKFSTKKENWKLIKEYHFGGYGKYNDELIHFINQFKKDTQIPLDPIYTGKMMFGILDMIHKNQFPKESKILVIHTGGLKGIEGFNQRLKNKKTTLKIV